MSAWFRSRSRREQRLILLMLALAALVLVWLLVLRPLGDALAAAKERHGSAVVALASARAQAAEIARLEGAAGGGPAASGPLDSFLSRAAGEAGFQLSQIQAAGPDQATVVMEAARPQAFFAWVAAMESAGLIVERLSARANADRTIAVEIAFRRRRG